MLSQEGVKVSRPRLPEAHCRVAHLYASSKTVQVFENRLTWLQPVFHTCRPADKRALLLKRTDEA
jgi:hypothetical protein